MNPCPYLAYAVAVGASLVLVQGQTPPVEDPTTLLNDYISIGEWTRDGTTAVELEDWNHNAAAIGPLKAANGVLEVMTIAGDPWIYRAGLTMLPPEFTIVEVRLRLVTGTIADSGSSWEMFWGSSAAGAGGFSGSRRVGYSLSWSDYEWHVLQFEMADVLAGNALRDFRIDCGQVAGIKFQVDYVRVGTISADSDGDGLPDTVETATGVFVSARDTGTDPLKVDTDGDSVDDGTEVTFGTDPNNPAEFPVASIDRYDLNPVTYIVDTPIDPNAPTVSNGSPLSFEVAPPLPDGLALDPTSGVIQGTPTVITAAADYTVTARFTGNKTATKVVTIEVRGPYVEYTPGKRTLMLNADLGGGFGPDYYGPPPAGFTISPPLPEGLIFDAPSGYIYGTPTAYSPVTTNVVTASYTGYPDSTTEMVLSVLATPAFALDPETKVLSYFSLGEFADPAEIDGWYQNGMQTPFTIEDGALMVTSIGGDPYFGKGLVLPHDYRIVELRCKLIERTSSNLRYYWAENAVGRGMSESTSVPFAAAEDAEYHVYQLDFTQAIEGPFNNIRFDSGEGAGMVLAVDYWRIGTFQPTLLVAAQTGGLLRLSWPAAATDYVLQSTDTPTAGWANDSAPVVVEGEENTVAIEPKAGAKFFRLIRP